MVYIFSVSLQLSAGIILLIWSLKNFQENVLNLYFPGGNTAARDVNNDDIILLDKDRLRDKANTILLSLFSFLDLSVGVFLSIFANKQYENSINLTLVIVISIAMIIMEILFSNLISAMKYKENVEMPLSDLEKKGLDVLVEISTKEIDEMFNS